jgi:SAM-dependent methyltransferase
LSRTEEAHKLKQREHFDHELKDLEFEITRPASGGRFYEYLMKFKVGIVTGLGGRSLVGRRALVVCAGSGMDAEILLGHGLDVICLDISEGALRRALERARRRGLSYALVAGDAERLPFKPEGVDYAFVHDGLHHLEEPELAITEMAAASRKGLFITEPAEALFMRVGERLGLVNPIEDSGNEVYRFHAGRLRAVVEPLGLTDVRQRRYLLKYFHQPGRAFRLFDLPGLFMLGKILFEVLGVKLLGGAGNKLAFAAFRPE